MTDAPETPNVLAFDDFMKVDIRVGEITKAEPVPKSEKLLKLEVYLGNEIGTRTILAGIAKSYLVDALIGKRCLVVVNLAPRKMMGIESHGMLLAGSLVGVSASEFISLATCNSDPGARIG